MNAAFICSATKPDTGKLMNNLKVKDERRQYKRYRFLGRCIELNLRQNATVLGCIKDISIGGVGVSYMDENTKLKESTELKAVMMEDKLYCRDIECKNVWDKAIVNDHPVITTKMRQSGLQFINLSEDQLSQIKRYIVNTLLEEDNSVQADFFYVGQ